MNFLSTSQKDHRAYGAYQMNCHFMDCIREGRQPETCFDDAFKNMELVETILHHAQI